MPLYTYRCQRCGQVFDYIECIAHRNHAQHCPGCNGPAERDVQSEIAGCGDFNALNAEHVRYSNAMGVNPEQIEAAKKAYPGSEYTPDGRLIVRSRQHKLKEAKRRGMIELT